MAVFGGLLWLARSRGLARRGPSSPGSWRCRSKCCSSSARPARGCSARRTVDRRTGRRLALWRTLALIGARAAGAELTRRLEPVRTPELDREREAAGAEIGDIMRRHPQATPEREAELRAAHARHSTAMPSLPRTIAPSLAVGVITTRLRRRLAPTVEVLASER